ncbi:MAG: prepilin-type N-terminal cleavage/methylation domain-containing protein [Candidatus Parcubacteria bacterium]|nr:prepilin-type N-terminal cleavage/methylation domain-containing protein [Candidatus Parcubacteria bacterium]
MKGFTLIESMIAVTILTLSIAGPLYTANSAIVASMTARDQLTASYLAQEGIEYVRAMRDYEYLAAYHLGGGSVSADAWSNFLTGSMPGHPGAVTQCRTMACSIDTTRDMGYGSGSSIFQCTDGGACAKLYLLASGIYATNRSSSSGTATAFSRTIQVVDIPGTGGNPLYPDKRIISIVSWDYHGIQHAVTVYDHLTPWQ